MFQKNCIMLKEIRQIFVKSFVSINDYCCKYSILFNNIHLYLKFVTVNANVFIIHIFV